MSASMCARAFRGCSPHDHTGARASADLITFFSVFAHLEFEETFHYLRDALRALKPGGKILFSFLDFRMPSQWNIFKASLKYDRPGKVPNQFMDRDAIHAWVLHAGLYVEALCDGESFHIPSDPTISWDDGREMSGHGSLGQSVCVLKRRQS